MVSTKTVGSLFALVCLAIGLVEGCSPADSLPAGDDRNNAQGGGPSGGVSTGGVSTGGVTAGGATTGGATTGGATTGGVAGTGGTTAGTTGLGGAPLGGAAGLGGVAATGGMGGATSGSSGIGGNPGCATGQLLCGALCVDATSDPVNCGACGTACTGGRSCVSGACQCPSGQVVCNNACVDTQTSPANCGACGTVCPTGQVCSTGRCALTCATNLVACSGACVSTQTDTNNCGACGTVCTGGRSCAAGACACPTGQTFCNNACVNTTNNASNCGACGTVCSGGRSCTNSACVCPTGQTFCNNACLSTATDVNNCGGCGTRCATGQTCSGGSCMGGTTTSGVIGWASVSGNGVTTTTGGSGGTTIDVNSASALSSNASSTARQIIRLTASVSVATLVVNSNKTIIGVGNNITISGGIELNNRNNVILQNIKLNARSTGVDGDGIRITNSHHVWIDHMEIWDAPDGNMDITDRSNFITVSWTKFWYSANPPDNNHRYSNLIGAGDAETGDEALLNVTWHHNWWADRVHERMPRVRFGDVHVFNNYYSSSGNNYCIRAGFHSNLLIENNHFQGVDTPHEAGEDGGTAIITARGNQYSSTTGAQQTRGTAFTPPYAYTLDAASSVGAAVQSGAGPH